MLVDLAMVVWPSKFTPTRAQVTYVCSAFAMKNGFCTPQVLPCRHHQITTVPPIVQKNLHENSETSAG